MISFENLQRQLKLNKEIILLDCRDSEAFDEAFIAGSIYIGTQFLKYSRLLKINTDQEIFLIIQENKKQAIELLNKLGFENIQTVSPFEHINELSESGLLDLIITIEPDELAMDLPFDQKARVIDLRQEDIFEKKHIDGSENITLDEFSDIGTIAEIEENENIYFCGNSEDISFVGSLIKRQGIHNFRKIKATFEEITATENIKIKKPSNKKVNED